MIYIYCLIKAKMKSILFIGLLLLSSVYTIEAPTEKESPSNLPKLPVFIGKGYNVLKGNPLSSEGIDPGFQHQIIQFTYQKGQTTEDDKFLIPDNVGHRKTTACSFSTQITQYRGTQSYQSQLKIKAQVSGGYNGTLVKAEFTQSTSFEKMHNETTVQNNSLTHASAECQCYQMSLNIFKPGIISDNFWNGVQFSYSSNNWQMFIDQFGTHFVYEVVMGGRAIQQIQYNFQSASQMESLKIDVSLAAKASFAKFYADASFDYQKYDTQIKYAQTLSQSIRQIYIGGQPPKTGKILDWQEKVINDPMPISYKLLPLSDLFMYNPDKSLDQKAVKSSFLAALDLYCAANKCQGPTPDKPKPPPATVATYNAKNFGGGGGGPYQWKYIHPTVEARKFMIRCGNEVDNFQMLLTDGITTIISPQFGGTGGGLVQWQVPKDQHVAQVEYRSGDRIDAMTFVTNKGNRSPRFGGTGGGYSLVTFELGYRIIGVYGRGGARLDNIGFILGKTEYHYGGYEKTSVIKTQLF